MDILVGVTSLCIGAAIFLLIWGYELHKQANAIDPLAMVRKDLNTEHGLPIERMEYGSHRLKSVRAKAAQFAPYMPLLPLPINMEQRLAWAGKFYSMKIDEFRGEQLLNGALLGLFGFLMGNLYQGIQLGMVLLIVLGALGTYLPLLTLEQDINKRQKQITLLLPDMIDLITTSVAAGLDIDRAIRHTINNMEGPISEEFHLFLSELRLGTSRPDAYRHLMWRNRSEELQTAIGALLQGQSLGVPITDTLYAQSEAVRERRLQRAKEEGAKASPRITLAMTVFMLPSIFFIFVAVMVFSMYQDFGPLLATFGW